MSWTPEQIEAVWQKGHIAPNNDPSTWRRDDCNAWMRRASYGDRDSQYGWEIDHITSQDHGGSDALSNLRPLQWRNNASKSSGRLNKCAVISNGTQNVIISE